MIADNPQQSKSVFISADTKISANDTIGVMDVAREPVTLNISLSSA